MSSFASSILPQLRELPPPLAALLLQQAQRYEVLFPAEKRELEGTLASLREPRTYAAEQAVQSFRSLRVAAGVTLPDWETQPSAYAEAFTAMMWSSGQIAEFRHAAQLLQPMQTSSAEEGSARAVVVIFDAALCSSQPTPELFRRLRGVGTMFTTVRASDARVDVRDWMRARVQAWDQPYGCWMVSGASTGEWSAPAECVRLGYGDLREARLRLLQTMNEQRRRGGGGPEELRSAMLSMRGRGLGMAGSEDPVVEAFAADVLVAGSGTQLYSTTFVQWTLREALRRSRARTVFAHFAARNAAASMDVRLANPAAEPPLDPAGSLEDAEMHAYMTYVNLLRLPAAKPANFLVWHAGYGQALLVGSGIEDGRVDSSAKQLRDLLSAIA